MAWQCLDVFPGVPPNMLDIKFRDLMVLYQLFKIIPCKCITLDFEKNIFFQVPFLRIMTLRRGFAFVNALRKLSSLLMGNKSWSLIIIKKAIFCLVIRKSR
jgi:hypothetical protein